MTPTHKSALNCGITNVEYGNRIVEHALPHIENLQVRAEMAQLVKEIAAAVKRLEQIATEEL